FYRAVNLLYRQSAEGKQPGWVAQWLDRGKPADLLALQRSQTFKNEVPRVIRPDVLLTDSGLSIIELDSIPGGIGLTAWLNQTYALISPKSKVQSPKSGDQQSPKSKVQSPKPDHQRGSGDSNPSSILNPLSSPGVIRGPSGMLHGFAEIFGDAPAVHVVVSEEAATYRPEMAWLCEQLGKAR